MNAPDPTKEELLEALAYYKNEEGFEFDAEVAIYAFAERNHGGQSSNLYSVLSTSDFRPGPMWKIESEGGMAWDMYADLEERYNSDEDYLADLAAGNKGI